MYRKPLLLSLFLAPYALAQGTPPPRPIVLAIDNNHDGKLSADEIANAPAALKTLDKNGDGQLDSLEYLASQNDPASNKPDETVQRLMAFDRNDDGVLTQDELPQRLQGLFARIDTNHDGKLTPEEIRASAALQTGPSGRVQHTGDATRNDPVLNAIDDNHDGILSSDEIANAPAALKALDKNGDGELSPEEIRPRQMTPSDRAKHMLDEWDTNKDAKIAKPEAPDRMQQQFDAIDTNHDGFLTEDELTIYFASLPPQQPRRPEGNTNPQGPRP